MNELNATNGFIDRNCMYRADKRTKANAVEPRNLLSNEDSERAAPANGFDTTDRGIETRIVSSPDGCDQDCLVSEVDQIEITWLRR